MADDTSRAVTDAPTRPEPTLADGLSLGDSGEITFTTEAGDVIRGWVGPSGSAHLDDEPFDGSFPTFTARELALYKALIDHLHTFGTWNHEKGLERYQLTPEAHR